MNASDILKSVAISYVLRGLTVLFAYLAQKGFRADDITRPRSKRHKARASK